MRGGCGGGWARARAYDKSTQYENDERANTHATTFIYVKRTIENSFAILNIYLTELGTNAIYNTYIYRYMAHIYVNYIMTTSESGN